MITVPWDKNLGYLPYNTMITKVINMYTQLLPVIQVAIEVTNKLM